MGEERALEIRGAVPADARSIASVHVASWKQAYPGLIPQTFLDSLTIEDRIARHELGLDSIDGPWTLVATSAQGIVGFASFGPSRDGDTPDLGELYALYVDPTVWSAGAGGALLDAACSVLVDRGFSGGALWVLEGNEQACSFYLRRGWEADGTSRMEDPYGPRVRVFRYRKSLLGG